MIVAMLCVYLVLLFGLVRRTDFHFTPKRFMVPRGFVISKVG